MVSEVIADGYNCISGKCKTHWFAAINILKDTDREFTEDILDPCVDGKVELLPGKNLLEWENASVSQPEELLFIEETADGINKKVLTEAERISEPATVKEATVQPVIAWCERNNQKWILKFKKGESVENIYESSKMLRSPAIISHNGTYLIAVEMDETDKTVIHIFTEKGAEYFKAKGRKPALSSSGNYLYVVSEVSKNGVSEIELKLKK